MNPEDDPEARIRELERPLADTARASELGATQPPGGSVYPPYPPPPPGPVPPPSFGYGGPFPGSTPRTSSGNRIWWILAAVFVVGTLALVGGIVAYSANRISRGFVVLSPTPSTSAISGSPRNTPHSPATSPAPPAGGSLSVAGVNEDKTIACNDSIVSVSGVSNTVVITGHCASLTVSGFQNTVTVDAADTIDASGLNNQVTYHSGSPKITNSGGANVVEQG